MNNDNFKDYTQEKFKQEFLKKLTVKEEDLKTFTNSAVGLTGECPDDFKCSICISIVFKPEECTKCNSLFCKYCIKSWTEKSSKACPMCKEKVPFKPMNKILAKYLNNTEIKGCTVESCTKHNQSMSYS